METLPATQLRTEDLELDTPEKRENLLSILNRNFSALAGSFRRPSATREFNFVVPAPLWSAAALVAPWVNYNAATHPVAEHLIDETGFVTTRGIISTGVIGAHALIYPVGYRPARVEHFSIASNNAFGLARVEPDGKLYPDVGSPAWFSLAGIRFLALTPAAPPAFAGEGWPIIWDTGLRSVSELRVTRVADQNPTRGLSLGAALPTWESDGGRVRIGDLRGLSPGRTYKVRLTAYG